MDATLPAPVARKARPTRKARQPKGSRSNNGNSAEQATDESAPISAAAGPANPLATDPIATAPIAPAATLPAGVRPVVAQATAADHAGIFQFLAAVFQEPRPDRFVAALENPYYEPCDRLLATHQGQIVSQLLLSQRAMQLGDVTVPVADLSQLATLPECRGQGHASRLLAAADEVMAANETMVGRLTTRVPHFFRRAGWSLCGRYSYSRANTRNLLSQLPLRSSPKKGGLSIRPWRHVELPGLMQLYQSCVTQTLGAYERTEAYWRWLVSHPPFDQIFVAVRSPGKVDLESEGGKIEGYAITRDEKVLELVAPTDEPRVAKELLARACREAIERDFHTVELHAPPSEPLHALFGQAGGQQSDDESCQGEVMMAKLPDPMRLIRLLAPELFRRAARAQLNRPSELGIDADGLRFRIHISRRNVRATADKRIGRSYLTCSQAELVRMLLGHADVADSVARSRIAASTRLAIETATTLFPRLATWRPPVDHLV